MYVLLEQMIESGEQLFRRSSLRRIYLNEPHFLEAEVTTILFG